MIQRDEVMPAETTAYDLEMFFDGGCPLCAKEVAWLRKLDRRQRIRFTDIAAPDFEPAEYGKTLDELMAQMHARRSDGVWLTGVEVFRQLYSSVGYRWLVAPTRLPGISWVLDRGYAFFAKHRLRLTGRCSQEGASCSAGGCRLPTDSPVAQSSATRSSNTRNSDAQNMPPSDSTDVTSPCEKEGSPTSSSREQVPVGNGPSH